MWIADKSKRIEVYDREHRYIGNLNEAGDLVQDRQVIFGADIYCFFEDEAHRLWMGSRENGIYVAVPEAENSVFFISNMIRKIREVSVRMLFMLLAKI